MMIKMDDHLQRQNHPAAEDLSCEDFQASMPELLGTDIRNHEHLKTCARCADLLSELEYIASIASALLQPIHEPGDSVWKKISASLSHPEENATNGSRHS